MLAAWASEPTAVAARREALAAIQKQSQPPMVKLASLVTAVQGAAIPPAKDPLFPEIVKAASETWSPTNLQEGRDMLIAESNPQARQLLTSSLSAYVGSDKGLADLTPSQKTGVRSDFIDVYASMPEAQQKDMEKAVSRMAGEHAAELLRGIASAP